MSMDNIIYEIRNPTREKYEDLEKKAQTFFEYWVIPDRQGNIHFCIGGYKTVNVFPDPEGYFSRISPITPIKDNTLVDINSKFINIKIEDISYNVYTSPTKILIDK